MHGRRMMKLFQLFDLTVKSIRLNVELKHFLWYPETHWVNHSYSPGPAQIEDIHILTNVHIENI